MWSNIKYIFFKKRIRSSFFIPVLDIEISSFVNYLFRPFINISAEALEVF